MPRKCGCKSLSLPLTLSLFFSTIKTFRAQMHRSILNSVKFGLFQVYSKISCTHSCFPQPLLRGQTVKARQHEFMYTSFFTITPIQFRTIEQDYSALVPPLYVTRECAEHHSPASRGTLTPTRSQSKKVNIMTLRVCKVFHHTTTQLRNSYSRRAIGEYMTTKYYFLSFNFYLTWCLYRGLAFLNLASKNVWATPLQCHTRNVEMLKCLAQKIVKSYQINPVRYQCSHRYGVTQRPSNDLREHGTF